MHGYVAMTYGYEDICEKPFRKISERTVHLQTFTKSPKIYYKTGINLLVMPTSITPN